MIKPIAIVRTVHYVHLTKKGLPSIRKFDVSTARRITRKNSWRRSAIEKKISRGFPALSLDCSRPQNLPQSPRYMFTLYSQSACTTNFLMKSDQNSPQLCQLMLLIWTRSWSSLLIWLFVVSTELARFELPPPPQLLAIMPFLVYSFLHSVVCMSLVH